MSKVIVSFEAGEPSVFQFGNEVVNEPGKDEIKIVQKAIGINYADVLARKGLLPAEMADFPLVDGFDAAGIVAEVGSNVTNIKVGDRVVYFLQLGAYREIRNMPSSAVVPIPDTVSFEAAAAFLTKGLTAKMLTQKLQPISDPSNYSVLVQGAAGGVATLLIRLLKSMGVKVFGIVSSAAKREAALSAGADEVMLYDEENITEHIKNMAGGKGVDAVIDGVGAATAKLSIKVLKEQGSLVFYGSHSGAVTEEQINDMAEGKNITFIYGQVGDYIEETGGILRVAAEIFPLIEQGIFDSGQIRTYDFEEVASVHTIMENRQASGVIALRL